MVTTFVGGRSAIRQRTARHRYLRQLDFACRSGQQHRHFAENRVHGHSGRIAVPSRRQCGQTVNASLGNIRTGNLGATIVTGSNLSLLDVTTTTGADNAIKIADEAIGQISQLRSNLGAFQKNILDSAIRYLGVGVENLSASESQIRDTNVASEVVALTKNQIIQQAGTSVLGTSQLRAAAGSVPAPVRVAWKKREQNSALFFLVFLLVFGVRLACSLSSCLKFSR